MNTLKYLYYVYAGLVLLGTIVLINDGEFEIFSFLSLVMTFVGVYVIAHSKN